NVRQQRRSAAKKRSPSSVVENVETGFVARGPSRKENPARYEHEQFFPAVEFHFAERSDGRMGAKNFHSQAVRPAPAPQPPAEISIFSGEHRMVESTQRAERVSAAKDETAGEQLQSTNDRV